MTSEGSAPAPPARTGEGDGERCGGGLGVWLPLVILESAFVVLDSSVVDVSISQIVADLDATVAGVQLAITACTLVMAALLFVGASRRHLGSRQGLRHRPRDLQGRSLDRARPNLTVLLIGWSLSSRGSARSS